MEDTSSTSVTSTSRAFSSSMKEGGGIDDDALNNYLKSELPELAASNEGYFAVPLSGTHWLDPSQKVMGQPAFFAKKEKPEKNEIMEIKKDYVFAYGRYGYGYYHLMTQDAWKALHKNYRKKRGHKNPQVAKLLSQRARSKFRNDAHPDQIKFANKAQTLNMRSKEARLAGSAMSLSVGAACAGF